MWIFALIKWIYVFINIYLIVRLYRALSGKGAVRVVRVLACLAAIFLSVAYPIARVVEGNGLWARSLAFAGAFWLAFVLHVLLVLLAVGLFRWCNRRFGHWFVITPERLPRWRYATCGGIIGAALLISGLGWLNTQIPVVHEITLPAPAGLETPLRIVALSDTHLGRLVTPEDFSRLIDLIEPLRPDLVLFAGDILDDYHGFDIEATHRSLARLKPALGVWGAPGNHEYYPGDAADSLRRLEAGGIRMLRDAWAELDGKLLLVGRDDRSLERFTQQKRKTLPELLADAPAAPRPPLIVLDHQPWNLEEAEQAGAFLQLSGHTHNGQLFPFNFLVALLYENAHGYSRRGDTHYWVSSGAGTWGPRARTTGRPEIVLIHVTPGA